jgi:hypothetical protein
LSTTIIKILHWNSHKDISSSWHCICRLRTSGLWCHCNVVSDHYFTELYELQRFSPVPAAQ